MKKRSTSWGTLKQLKEYRYQLEKGNLKLGENRKELDAKIEYLKDAIAQMGKVEDDTVLPPHLKALLSELSFTLPSKLKSEK